MRAGNVYTGVNAREIKKNPTQKIEVMAVDCFLARFVSRVL